MTAFHTQTFIPPDGNLAITPAGIPAGSGYSVLTCQAHCGSIIWIGGRILL